MTRVSNLDVTREPQRKTLRREEILEGCGLQSYTLRGIARVAEADHRRCLHTASPRAVDMQENRFAGGCSVTLFVLLRACSHRPGPG